MIRTAKTLLHQWTTGKGLGIIAILISSAAFWVSYQGLGDAREHNKLSLKPIIQVIKNNSSDTKNDQGIFHIHNDGIGPATITNVAISINNILISQPEPQAWLTVYNSLGLVETDTICLENGILKGSTLPPSKDHYILKIVEPDFNVKTKPICNTRYKRQRLNTLLEKVTIQVTYQSVYNEKFMAKSRSAFRP